MKSTIISLLFLFISYQINCQTVELPNTFISINHDYLSLTETNLTLPKIQNLEAKIVDYNIHETPHLFDNKKDIYNVTFKTENAIIVASYNSNGKVIKTTERFTNVRLPLEVMKTISHKYPHWAIVEDTYLVKYNCNTDKLSKVFKIKLKNNDKVITVKTDEKGVFI